MRCISTTSQAHHSQVGSSAIADKEADNGQGNGHGAPKHDVALTETQNVDAVQGEGLNTNILIVGNAEKRIANALSEEARAAVVAEIIPPISIKALLHLLLYSVHQEAIAFRSATKDREVPVRVISGIINQCITALAALMHLTGRSTAQYLPFEDQPEGGSCDYHVCEAISQAMTEGAQLVPRARIAQLQAERGADALRPLVQQMIQEGQFDFTYGQIAKRTFNTERVSTVAFVWTRMGGDVLDSRCLLVTTTRFRLILLRVPADTAVPQMSDLHVMSSPRSMQDLQRVIFDLRMRQILCLVWEADEADVAHQFQLLVFESSSRRRLFQQALRRVPRKPSVSGEMEHRKHQAGRARARGILECHVKSDALESLRETCQVRRGGIPLVSVSFVYGNSITLHRQLEMVVLTRCSVTVISYQSFWSKFWRRGDEKHYDEEVTIASIDTDSDDDRLPPFSENVVATSNDHADKCEALHGSPWDIDDLQGVWFLSEASPKVRLQFGQTIEITFTSDGERQRFRRHLATILAEGAVSRVGKSSQGWAVVPTDKTDLRSIQKETEAVRPGSMLALPPSDNRS